MFPILEEILPEIASRFKERAGVGFALISNGSVEDYDSNYDWNNAKNITMSYRDMVAESVRWGEPQITIDSRSRFVWCVPVFANNSAVAGLFAALEKEEPDNSTRFVHDTAWYLFELSNEANLSNHALMERNRLAALADARRAEALHIKKQFKNPRDIYLIEEAKLLRAIRSKDPELARQTINTILLGVYNLGHERFDLLKPLVLEMVVQMYRAAIEEGADSNELLGLNSNLLIDLLKVENEYTLNTWLARWLETFVNIEFEKQRWLPPRSLSPVILYVKNNLEKPLTRDRVARACGLSPSYLSRLLKASTGYTFSELLNRFRTDRACSLLDHTNLTASDIAYAAGFSDQSYFTKTFKRYQGTTPGAYRGEQKRTTLPSLHEITKKGAF